MLKMSSNDTFCVIDVLGIESFHWDEFSTKVALVNMGKHT